jgi:hypothetical protein
MTSHGTRLPTGNSRTGTRASGYLLTQWLLVYIKYLPNFLLFPNLSALVVLDQFQVFTLKCA